MRGRKMLPDFGSMNAALVFDSRDVKWSTVCFPATLHGTGAELLEVQLVAGSDPSYGATIGEENFEYRVLSLE